MAEDASKKSAVPKKPSGGTASGGAPGGKPPKTLGAGAPGAGGAPGGAPGGGGGGNPAASAAKVADSASKVKNADTKTEKVQHTGAAVGEAGKNVGGLYGAGISGVGQGVSEAARVKAEGGSGGDAAKAALTGAAIGAASGALGGKDGGQAEALGDKAKSAQEAKRAEKAADKPGVGDDKPKAEGSEKSDLGAGGTGPAAPAKPEEDKNSLGKNAAIGAGAVGGAQGAAQIGTAMIIANFIKTMVMGAVAMVGNALNAVLGFALGVVGQVAGFFGAIGAGIATAVGGAISATVASFVAVGLLVGGVGGAAVAIVTGVNTNSVAQRDAYIECAVSGETLKKQKEGEDSGSLDEKTRKSAEEIYSVFSAWGMSDENIAGILGNFKAESGFDPTSVQNFLNDKFVMTDAKKAAALEPSNGIGFGQWTATRNTALRDYASGIKEDWYTLKTQLGFMVGPDTGSGVVKGMIEKSEGSPEKAAVFFHDQWERSADTDLSHREKAASEMFALMGDWSSNSSLADSILEQSGASLGDANANANNSLEATDVCNMPDADSLTGLKEGGLNLEEAKKFMEHFKKVGEGDLQRMYPGGGPGDCGYGKADNCVGFSTWFFNMYTTIKSYPSGDGRQTAEGVAAHTGVKPTKTPTVYSVFSVPGFVPNYTSEYGHTGVVLGIEKDKLIIGEANCGSNHARTHAIEVPLSQVKAQGWTFADVTKHLDKDAMKGVGK